MNTKLDWLPVAVNAMVLWIFSLYPAQAGGHPIKCQPVVFAEYCFPGGSFHDLVPLDRLEAQFSKRAQVLKSERSTPSRLPPARRQELEDMWSAALAAAFNYADRHSLKLATTGTVSPKDDHGNSSELPSPLSQGVLFRLTFSEDEKGVFHLNPAAVELHFQRSLGAPQTLDNKLPSELQVLFPLLQMLGGSVSHDGGFVELNSILALPLVKPFASRFEQASKKSGFSFLGIFGFEVVAALEMAFEEKIRDRNRALKHAIHFYDIGAAIGDMTKSPQVLFTGELMLPDAAVAKFSDTELMLLMFHEAMHLARPNIFMLLSAADLIQKERFPDLNTVNSATYLANLLGQDAPGKTINCPLDIAHDDELATDYYVFHLLRRQPELAHAYNAFLKRLHTEFDPGYTSQMSYRVQLGDYMVGYLAEKGWKHQNAKKQEQLIWQAFLATLFKRGSGYLSGEPMRMEHFWQEMSEHPELKHDVKMMQTFINYYKNNARLHEEATPGTNSNLNCRDIARMMRTSE